MKPARIYFNLKGGNESCYTNSAMPWEFQDKNEAGSQERLEVTANYQEFLLITHRHSLQTLQSQPYRE